MIIKQIPIMVQYQNTVLEVTIGQDTTGLCNTAEKLFQFLSTKQRKRFS